MKISQEIAMKSHDLFAGRSVNHIGEKNCLFLGRCIKWSTSVKTYTLSKRLHERTLPPASLVPLVLSGPLCPAGISPPRGESPLKGRLILGSLEKGAGSRRLTEGLYRRPFTLSKRFHIKIPPPPNGGPPPLSGKAISNSRNKL